LRDRWPWPDEAHIATKDVPELREFIEAAATKPSPDRGEARILDHLEADHLLVRLRIER
jgi:hypothetical protein